MHSGPPRRSPSAAPAGSSVWRANGRPPRARGRRPSRRHLQRAGRRRVAVELGIALVGEDLKSCVRPARSGRASRLVGDRPLRVGRRADIGDRRAVQHLGISARNPADARSRRGRHEDRLGPHGKRATACRPGRTGSASGSRAAGPRWSRGRAPCRVEQPLARAVQRHDLGGRVDRHAVAPVQPGCDRGRAVRACRRSAGSVESSEFARRSISPIQGGKACLGSPIDMCITSPPGRMRIQKRPQTRKRIGWQVRKPLRKRMKLCSTASGRGH
jgi:hypothetical protein